MLGTRLQSGFDSIKFRLLAAAVTLEEVQDAARSAFTELAVVPHDPVSGGKAEGISASGIGAAVRGPRIKTLAQRSDGNTSAIGWATMFAVVCESRRSGAENPGSKQA